MGHASAADTPSHAGRGKVGPGSRTPSPQSQRYWLDVDRPMLLGHLPDYRRHRGTPILCLLRHSLTDRLCGRTGRQGAFEMGLGRCQSCQGGVGAESGRCRTARIGVSRVPGRRLCVRLPGGGVVSDGADSSPRSAALPATVSGPATAGDNTGRLYRCRR